MKQRRNCRSLLLMLLLLLLLLRLLLLQQTRRVYGHLTALSPCYCPLLSLLAA